MHAMKHPIQQPNGHQPPQQRRGTPPKSDCWVPTRIAAQIDPKLDHMQDRSDRCKRNTDAMIILDHNYIHIILTAPLSEGNSFWERPPMVPPDLGWGKPYIPFVFDSGVTTVLFMSPEANFRNEPQTSHPLWPLYPLKALRPQALAPNLPLVTPLVLASRMKAGTQSDYT